MIRMQRLAGVTLALSALLVAAVACGDDDDDGGLSSAPARADAANQYSAPSGTSTAAGTSERLASGDTAIGGAGDNAPALPSQADRKIIFNATLGLEVTDVALAFNDVSAIARVAGGYVEKSAFSGGTATEGKDRTASLTLRVPADGYQDTLAKLRALPGAKVKDEGSRSNEVTEQYTDLQSRLRNLQQTETSYLKLLQEAKTIPDILTVTDRLNGIRTQIEQIQGRLNVFDRLTELATVDVSLAPITPGKTAPKSDGPKSFVSAFADAWDGSVEAARYLLSAAGVLAVGAIWIGIPAGLVIIGSRRFRRRNAARPAA